MTTRREIGLGLLAAAAGLAMTPARAATQDLRPI